MMRRLCLPLPSGSGHATAWLREHHCASIFFTSFCVIAVSPLNAQQNLPGKPSGLKSFL